LRQRAVWRRSQPAKSLVFVQRVLRIVDIRMLQDFIQNSPVNRRMLPDIEP
jgi:hypothetical protein